MTDSIDKLRAKRRSVTRFAVVYFLLIAACVAGTIIFSRSPIPVAALMMLGIPWGLLLAPFSWAIAHNSSQWGFFFLAFASTVPNIILLVRWITRMYIVEKAYVTE